MISFRIKNPLVVNLNWWPKTQKEWAPILLADQKPFWKKERNPTFNTPWAKLTPKYEAWKKKNYPGQPILRLTGVMQDTANILPGSNGGFKVETTSYGPYLQFGTKKMVARPWMGIPKKSLVALGLLSIKNIFFSKNRN